jgi:TP901 family phage tail tape measure protein
MALNNMGLGFHVSAKDEASPALESVSNKLAGTEKAAKKAKVSFEDVGSQMGGIGDKMKVAGTVGAAALGLAVHQAAQFEVGIAEVGTLVPHANFSIEEMRNLVQELATTYGGDLETQTKALYQSISSGAANAADAQQLLNAANRLAIAGKTDQTTAITGITKVMNNYGLSFKDAGDISDAFFVAVKGGQTTVGELGQYVGDLAASAKNAGVSMEEMIAAMGTGATLLRDTGAAATGLKAAMANIAHPTKDAADEAQRLGIKFDAATLRSKGLKGFLDSITKSSKFTADSLTKLFGSVEASNAITALTANNGKAFNDMLDGMKHRSGGAEGAFKEMSATMAMQGSILKANVQTVLVQMGDALLPMVKELTGLVTKAVKAFAGAPPIVKKVAAGFLAFTSVALLVVGGLLGIVSGIAAAAAAGEALLIALAAAAGLMLQFAVMAGVAVAAFYLFKRAYEENLGGFKDFVDDTYKKVKLAWDALVQVFSDGGFSGSVLTELNKAENQGIKAFAIQAFLWFNRIKEFFAGVGRGFTEAMATLRPAFDRLVQALKSIGAMLGFVQDKPWEAAEAFRTFGETGERVGGIIGKVAEFVVDAFTNVAKFVSGAIQVFQEMRKLGLPLSTAFGNVLESFVRIGEALGLVSKGGSANGEMWKTLGQVVGFVVGAIVNAIAGMVNAFATVVAVVASLAGGVIGMFQGLWNMLAGFIQFINAVFAGRWGEAWQGMARMVYGVVQFLLNLLNGFVGSILAVVDKVAGAFGKKSNLAGALTAEKDSLLNSTQDGLGLINATGGKDRSALFATGGAQPATVPVAQNAANAAAAANAPPIQTTAVTTVVLDGEKVGEAVAKHQAGTAARTPGAPTPAPA